MGVTTDLERNFETISIKICCKYRFLKVETAFGLQDRIQLCKAAAVGVCKWLAIGPLRGADREYYGLT